MSRLGENKSRVKVVDEMKVLVQAIFTLVMFSVVYSSSCTLPLSTLSSSFSLDHHLYADYTQLFFSFHPLNFDSSIPHLQDALQHISSWMTANLLTLSSSKTEFLLIGLKSQLFKIHNSSLDISHSARNLGVIFDEHGTSYLLWPNYISPKPVTITFVNFAVSGLTLIPQLPVVLKARGQLQWLTSLDAISKDVGGE